MIFILVNTRNAHAHVLPRAGLFGLSSVNILVGDFNVDFDRQSPMTGLLVDLMKSLDFCACDLLYRDLVKFTYERDDGQARSWIDHIMLTL